jgi:serine/threonine protein phosphatase PrpC
MITCPECGQQANDDAKFCDRCGQGLTHEPVRSLPTSIPALEPDTELTGGYRILTVLEQNASENRYRAEQSGSGTAEIVQLREQLGPAHATPAADAPSASAEEDPAGPHAKTAELRLKRASPDNPVDANGSAADAVAPGTDEESRSPISVESQQRAEPNAASAEVGSDEVIEAAGEEGTHRISGLVESEPASGTEGLDSLSGQNAHSGASSEGARTGESVHTAEATIQPAVNGASLDQRAAGGEKSLDLGEMFGRVLSLSMTLNHPAFLRAIGGFADNGRVYLVYPDEPYQPLSSRAGGLKMAEPEALNIAIQVCQAASFVHRRGLRVNDICPDSVVFGNQGRIRLTGLDYISNDNELQAEPIYNDGYTAPEIYRGKKVDKRADVFSIGALLYTCLTGERLESETWREEAGPIRFYPPHVVTPGLEQAVRRALVFDPAGRWASVEAFKAELVKYASAVKIRAEALTDVGMVREHNEDSVLTFEYRRDALIEPAQAFLYLVADGMGGAEAGEVASSIAVGAIRRYVEDKLAVRGSGDLRTIVQQALEYANSQIVEYQASHAEARSMGSTAVAALIIPPEAAVAWVGDSRAYLQESGCLRQVTKDHSLVQRLIEIGQISPEEARHHEHKNVITRSLGARPHGPAGAESLMVRLKRSDRLLLCSDGLTTHVEDPQIGEILRRHSDPTAAAQELVVAANAGGGSDNISVVVIVAV